MLGQKLKAFQKIDNTYVLLDGHRKQRRKRKRISYLNLLDKNTRLDDHVAHTSPFASILPAASLI